jgi:putative ABC transport system permease protein
VKIISLGCGLAVGLILITKVLYEQSFDKFYPEADRIYMVYENIRFSNEGADKTIENSGVPGGVCGGMREEITGIESITMSTGLLSDFNIFTQDKKRVKIGVAILADSCFFDVVPRPMIAGDYKSTLGKAWNAIVSKSVADKIGGDVVGQQIEVDEYGFRITIGGVFEDLPKNSGYDYDVIISAETMEKIWGWDPRSNWLGNDRYRVLFKPIKGVDIKDIAAQMPALQEKHIPSAKLKGMGVEFKFSFEKFADHYSSREDVKRMNLLLTFLAIAMIAAAVLNYVLIALSSMVIRSKEMAIYKCYGAKNLNIRMLIFTETSLHLLLSLILAACLILLFQNTVEDLLAAPLSSLFMAKSIVVLFGICVVILVVASYLPSRMFSGIPVISVFRNFAGESKHRWKLVLLFLQFTGAVFLLSLLVIVGKQYSTMINNNPGYDLQNIVYFTLPADSNKETRQAVLDHLASLPEVESVTTSQEALITSDRSGNNVSLPGSSESLFNFRDLYYMDENFLPTFGIKIIDGSNFSKESQKEEMLVSRSFAERLTQLTGWTDGVIGKRITVTEHGDVTISGIYENIRIGSIGEEETRPTAMFYNPNPNRVVSVRLNEINNATMQKVSKTIEEVLPNREIHVLIYEDMMIDTYQPALRFRNSVMIGSIITFIILLIGLIGYLRNEILRRSSEIAVRKINGAEVRDILSLFIRDILYIALPASVVGVIVAYFIAGKWMENFSVKTPLSWWIFAGCIIGTLVVIVSVIIINCLRISRQNPVDTLKQE